jgi:hypothetical protein
MNFKACEAFGGSTNAIPDRIPGENAVAVLSRGFVGGAQAV